MPLPVPTRAARTQRSPLLQFSPPPPCRVAARWRQLALAGGLALAAVLVGHANESAPLHWTARAPQFRVDAEHPEASLSFAIQNRSADPVTILAVTSSCGCTVMRLPPLPWRLEAGAARDFGAVVDLRGRHGELHKTIVVATDRGALHIPVRLVIPPSPISEERRRNQLVALADARAIFRDDCARCHAAPAAAKTGPELYAAACAICHEATPRASAVPDLGLVADRRPEHWRQWIEHGKAGSLMPPFAKANGGILDEAQVESLVRFLVERR